jgi:uncharacterized membrane protein YkoI
MNVTVISTFITGLFLPHTLQANTTAERHCPQFLSTHEAVRKTVLLEARGATVQNFKILRIENKTIYIAEIDVPSDRKVYVDEFGGLIRLMEEIPAAELPLPVLAAARAENGVLDEVERETSGDKVAYLIEIDRSDRTEVILKVDSSGAVISRREESDD